MGDIRVELVGAVRTELAAARAAARARFAMAKDGLRAAQTRLAAAQNEELAAPIKLGAEREARLHVVDARHREKVLDLAARAAKAAKAEPGVIRVGAVTLTDQGLTDVEPVPALVPLLDRSHVVIDAEPGSKLADGLLATLLLGTIRDAPPGEVRLLGYDPERLGRGLAGFGPLAPAGLLTFVGPGGLAGLLDGLVEEIRRINASVLAGDYGSLRELAQATGRRPEPWRVAVLLGTGALSTNAELSRHEQAQLARVVRTGIPCGVHVVACGVPITVTDDVTVIGAAAAVPAKEPEVEAEGESPTAREPARPRAKPSLAPPVVSLSTAVGLPVAVDPPPKPAEVAEVCKAIADEHRAGPAPAPFEALLPERGKYWTESSAADVRAPIGEGADGHLVELVLGDSPPHALIGGPSGTGKTNLIYAWLGSLAARYSPGEIEFYLLDFKEGVSFARFAPGRRDRSWLPHVRLVGVNVNDDREFGVALLRFLGEELRRRAEAAKLHEVTKLAELREEDPGGHWPRVLAVIDEFQVLLAGRDALAAEAVNLLEDLARRGRSQGIHLVLASQDVAGIEALWGRSGLVAQFSLRIALPRARRILAESNVAAEQIPRYHAVVNADSGAVEANRIVRVPDASDRDAWGELQRALWHARPEKLAPPRLFDGDAVPQLPVDPGADDEPAAIVGELIDVVSRPAVMPLTRAPGRNLAVLGSRVDEACAVLASAARSLVGAGPVVPRFRLACLDRAARPAARALSAALPEGTTWHDQESVADLLAEIAAGLAETPDAAADADDPRPQILIMYAVDAAAHRLAAPARGHEHLRTILHSGPERHTHVLGWWRGVARLREDLGGPGARLDPIGAWVALDVHGAELAPLSTQPGGPAWYPRPWRGLFFDRSVHRAPQVIVPYSGPAVGALR